MTRLIPFLAAAFAAGDIPFDWISLVDRWGIAGAMAFIAWMLWKRDESGRKELTSLLRESIEAQISTREELKKQTDILNQRKDGK